MKTSSLKGRNITVKENTRSILEAAMNARDDLERIIYALETKSIVENSIFTQEITGDESQVLEGYHLVKNQKTGVFVYNGIAILQADTYENLRKIADNQAIRRARGIREAASELSKG